MSATKGNNMRCTSFCRMGLVILTVTFLAVYGYAELTPNQTKQAQALIKQFTHAEFAVRQKAVEQLIQMGPAVLPLIRKTLAETDDEEVKLRCQMVIKGITEKPKRPWKFVENHITDLGPPDDRAGHKPPAYAANGEAIAYAVKRNGKEFMLHNGREGMEYDEVKWITLSENGKHLAYAAKRGEKWFAVCDGVEGSAYDAVVLPVFSPDDSRLAYNAKRGERWFVVCDGKEWNQIEYYYAGDRKYFSNDSKHLISTARRIGFPGKFPFRDFIIIDGSAAGPLHDGIRLAPPGDTVRFIAIDGDEVGLFELDWREVQKVPEKLGERLVKPLGKVPPGGRAEWRMLIAPNWQSVAWLSTRKELKRVIFNGKEVGPYDGMLGTGRTPFSPDGKRFAFIAKRKEVWFPVVGGKEGAHYQQRGGRPTEIVFSPCSCRGSAPYRSPPGCTKNILL